MGKDDSSGVEKSGSVYIFERVNGAWEFQKELFNPDAAVKDYFGRSVSLQGNNLAVGSQYDDSAGSDGAGSVYLYQRDGSEWVLRKEFFAPDDGVDRGKGFGTAVCLDGDSVAASAPYGTNKGSVLFYNLVAGAETKVGESTSTQVGQTVATSTKVSAETKVGRSVTAAAAATTTLTTTTSTTTSTTVNVVDEWALYGFAAVGAGFLLLQGAKFVMTKRVKEFTPLNGDDEL